MRNCSKCMEACEASSCLEVALEVWKTLKRLVGWNFNTAFWKENQKIKLYQRGYNELLVGGFKHCLFSLLTWGSDPI